MEIEIFNRSEWLSLDSLSDAPECTTFIWHLVKDEKTNISAEKIKDTIYYLYERGLIFIDGIPAHVSREDILSEETNNLDKMGKYYFGMTSTGVRFWEEASKKHDEPQNWTRSWVLRYDFIHQEGHIDGTSCIVCLNKINKLNSKSNETLKGWQIDMNNFGIRRLKDFRLNIISIYQAVIKLPSNLLSVEAVII